MQQIEKSLLLSINQILFLLCVCARCYGIAMLKKQSIHYYLDLHNLKFHKIL